MSNCFSVTRILPLLMIVPALVFAAPAGKVRSALGSVERQKLKQKDWNALRVGSSIFQTDRVRTGVESEVVFALPDGSIITIAENAEVEMSNLLETDGKGAYKTVLDIKKGHVNFAVQKLQNKNSEFKFKTGTATASIRGTNGFVGGEDGVFYASLATGKLDIQPEGSEKVNPIVAGETIFGKDSLVTMKLKSSGDAKFARMVKTIVKESKGNVEDLKKAVVAADSVRQQEKAKESLDALSDNGFVLNTASPVEICNDGLTVEGQYRTSDPNASLIVKVGSAYTSENLVRIADGNVHSFVQKISVNDANSLWNEKQASISFVAGKAVDSKTIDLSVNKTCAGVNQTAPEVKFLSYDSIACKMQVSIGNMQSDAGVLNVLVDGSPIAEEAITKNEQKRYNLSSGVHAYGFALTDQAGNSEAVEKKLGCYPVKRFNIDVYGKAKEVVMAPPPPQGMQDRIVKTLQFRIKSPENDPVYLHKVTIKQNGKIILQETLSQIQSLDYQVPLELVRGAQNRFDIEVVHKSGFTAKAKKVYEVP